ncbi:MAG: hypothetical protein HOV96_41720, partial [Nonomuraea sp.]|nr:hypothetical protein [Nonomuraea sp.]
ESAGAPLPAGERADVDRITARLGEEAVAAGKAYGAGSDLDELLRAVLDG